MRLLPDAQTAETTTLRRMVIGLSSVQRKVDYLTFTLSHLFVSLGGNEMETAIVVHLADTDDEWVHTTCKHLNQTFSDEVVSGRLHVIHAPRSLYRTAEVTDGSLASSGDFKRRSAAIVQNIGRCAC